MPVSSVIVGVDLVAIKPINNVITLTEDITTASCRSALRRELKTWKADLVLNDGAPNVGKNWIHDAFQQNCLTLSALELATEFLMPNGTFVTKVFRSKDYNALVWVLSKLFKKVSATKPAASRNESAEIFIVAQNYLAPDKIDPRFFSANYLFEDAVNEEQALKKEKVNLLKPVNKQRKTKAEGYKDGESIQFFAIKASDFLSSHDSLETLSKAHEIIFDDPEITNHALTTQEIMECCKDIKVLGRKEILSLVHWRKKMRSALGIVKKKEPQTTEAIEEESFDEEDEEAKKLRRKKKKVAKERRKLNERLQLKMIIKNDQLVEEDDFELFNLKKIKSKKALEHFEEFSLSEDSDADNDEPYLGKYVSYEKDTEVPDLDSEEEDNNDGDAEEELPVDEDDDVPATKTVKSVTFESDDDEDAGLVHSKLPKDKRTEMFFKKGVLSEFMNGDDSDDDEEILETLDEMSVQENSHKKQRKVQIESSDDDSSEDEDNNQTLHPKCRSEVRLDPESLALAEKMIVSSKAKRDIIDNAWNRYTRGEAEGAPSWFRKDEEKFFRKTVEVEPEALQRYRNQQKELNVRPIKKVAEAKARKKKKALAKMERTKKKAEAITDAPDMTDKEKGSLLKNLYKKALTKRKKSITYVVAKKGAAQQRPEGHKGKYKVVDKRMKKDNLRKKKNEKKERKAKKTTFKHPKGNRKAR